MLNRSLSQILHVGLPDVITPRLQQSALAMRGGGRLITPATRASLQRDGYAVVHAPAAARHCAAAVAAWATSGSFRYPSVSEPPSTARASGGDQMDVLYRRAFNELYSLTADCASSVWAGLPAPPTAARPFAADAVGTRPFADARARSSPYAGSFCSVFNFDHGFLNDHRDRGLITAIYGRAAGTSDGQVRFREYLLSGSWATYYGYTYYGYTY